MSRLAADLFPEDALVELVSVGEGAPLCELRYDGEAFLVATRGVEGARVAVPAVVGGGADVRRRARRSAPRWRRGRS